LVQIEFMVKLITRIFALLFFGLIGCSPGGNKTTLSAKRIDLLPISYAKGFKIEKFKYYEKVTVLSPWQRSRGISFEYFLVPFNKEVPTEIKGKQIIRTPIKRIICLSTSHIGFLGALNEIGSLIGLSGSGFVTDTMVQKAIKENLIKDVGYDQGLNYETLLGLKPDVIMAYGVGGEVTGIINKLRDLNLNVVVNGEYLEESPLAKTEWIKFVGALYNKEKEASVYFTKIENNYISIKNKVSGLKLRPLVLTGLPFKDIWWMAGGNSNLAALISDAGGEYIWKDNQSKDAFVVSIEDVIMRTAKADYWINCGTVNSIKELLSADSRFISFPQVTKKTIYNNNLAVNNSGGNDYWEKGVVRPDLILSDLVKIFHPECDSSKAFNFYKKIE
jgi:iron complex transport system substrate-binding protein